MASRWTIEQCEWLKNNAKGKSSKELTNMFNKKFNLSRTILSIRHKKNEFNIHKNKPHSKEYKPWNFAKIGTERINFSGYQEIKISKNKWQPKHIYIYEKKYGKIPKKYTIIFLDGNKNNLDISNLMMVKREVELIMIRNKLIFNNAELTKTGSLIAEMIHEKNKRKKIIGDDINGIMD